VTLLLLLLSLLLPLLERGLVGLVEDIKKFDKVNGATQSSGSSCWLLLVAVACLRFFVSRRVSSVFNHFQ
jgi:hypothetical protein